MAAKHLSVELERVQRTATMFRVSVPPDLRSALAADEAAADAFDRLSSTHLREYVEWVEGAKRPATRARRITGTLDRVRAGKATR